jgi:hypothetical protein
MSSSSRRVISGEIGRALIGYLFHWAQDGAWQGVVQAPGLSLSHRLPTLRRVALTWPARAGRCMRSGRGSRGVC